MTVKRKKNNREFKTNHAYTCAFAQSNESIYNNEERTLLELLKNEKS